MSIPLYHIDHARLERLRSQGYWHFTVPAAATIIQYQKGDSVIHLIDGDVGFCESCQREVKSLMAENPATLETEKMGLCQPT